MVVAHIHTPKITQGTSKSASSNIKVIIQILVGASALIFLISEGLSFQNPPVIGDHYPKYVLLEKKNMSKHQPLNPISGWLNRVKHHFFLLG